VGTPPAADPAVAPARRFHPGPAGANRRKKEAIAQLTWLAVIMDDVDARINALIERTRDLELD